MSQFFIDIDQDPKESKKKSFSKKESSDEEEIIDKKCAKFNSVKAEIYQAEESISNKSVDKVLRTLNKNLKFLNKESKLIDNFFEKVYANKKISKAIKEKCEAFMEKFRDSGKKVVISKISERKKCIDQELSLVVNIEDFDIKCSRLDDLLSTAENSNEIFKVIMTKLLVFIYKSQSKYLDQIYSQVTKLAEIYDNNESLSLAGVDLKKLFVKHIKFYLSTILSFIHDEEYSYFLKLAKVLKKYDEQTVSKEVLEFKYFFLNQFEKNDHVDFKLLYLVKISEYKEALEYFHENETYTMESKERSVIEGTSLLGRWAFNTGKYDISFKMLQKCYYSGYKDLKINLYVLCCILNHRIREESFFKMFLDKVSMLDENILLLKSGSKENESFRAFLLLMSYDYVGCEKILKTIQPGIDCLEYLKENVESLIQSCTKTF